MLGTLIFAAVLTYGTFALFHILGKLGNYACPASVADEPLFDSNGEQYNEPINLVSPNNTASNIIKKGRYFYVTIENSFTGEKQTLSNTNKKYLCWDANDTAWRFSVKEQEKKSQYL